MIQMVSFFKAVTLCVLLLVANSPLAIAQQIPIPGSPGVPSRGSCDGRFDRMLQGFTISTFELEHFLQNDAAVIGCRRALNYKNPADMTIDAWIAMHDREKPARVRAFDRFIQACTSGLAAACYYAALFDPRTQDLTGDDQQLRSALEALAVNGPPVAAVKLAEFLRLGDSDNDATRTRIDNLLTNAQARGDATAAYDRASMAMRLKGAERQETIRKRLQEAADMGSVLAMMTLGLNMQASQPEAARAWFLQVANSDERFFQSYRADASYELAKIHRSGIGGLKDAYQEEYWLKRAAALGNEDAREKLRRK